MNSIEAARLEAKEIDNLPPKRNLRVHVSGDCRNKTAAGIVGSAMVRYEKRGKRRGVLAYTYTHAHKSPYNVRASAWQGARVLASCDSDKAVTRARSMGYKASAVVEPEATPTHNSSLGLRVLCPFESAERDCDDCMLCANTEWLEKYNVIIMFPSHGTRADQAAAKRGGCYADNFLVKLQSNGVKVVEQSRASKVRGMSVTYANIKTTCPTTCAFYPLALRTVNS